jgi:hypothetical protein
MFKYVYMMDICVMKNFIHILGPVVNGDLFPIRCTRIIIYH